MPYLDDYPIQVCPRCNAPGAYWRVGPSCVEGKEWEAYNHCSDRECPLTGPPMMTYEQWEAIPRCTYHQENEA